MLSQRAVGEPRFDVRKYGELAEDMRGWWRMYLCAPHADGVDYAHAGVPQLSQQHMHTCTDLCEGFRSTEHHHCLRLRVHLARRQRQKRAHPHDHRIPLDNLGINCAAGSLHLYRMLALGLRQRRHLITKHTRLGGQARKEELARLSRRERALHRAVWPLEERGEDGLRRWWVGR